MNDYGVEMKPKTTYVLNEASGQYEIIDVGRVIAVAASEDDARRLVDADNAAKWEEFSVAREEAFTAAWTIPRHLLP